MNFRLNIYDKKLNSAFVMVIFFLFFLDNCFSLSFTFKNKVNHHDIFHFLNKDNSCDLKIQITNCSPDKESRARFTRYRHVLFLASVFMQNCDLKLNPLEKLLMTWEIWKLESREKKVKKIIHKTSLLMEEDALDYGIYRLKLIVNMLFQSSNKQTKSSETECFFEIVDIGTQTIIHGGFIRSINLQFNIYFEVITMLAPARHALSKTVHVTYLWTCIDRNDKSSAEQRETFCKDFQTSETQRLIKGPLASAGLTSNPNDDLRVIKSYWFSLFTSVQSTDSGQISFEGQSESQIVHITDNPGVNIGIVCLLNCGGYRFRTNPQNIIHLEAKFNRSVLKSLSKNEMRFVWLYQSEKDEEPNDVPMEAKCNDTVTEDTELRIKSDFLRNNTSYLFYIKSILNGKTLQTAAIKIFTSAIPSGVTCTMHIDNHTIGGIHFYNIFCSFTNTDKDQTSLMYEFYNKNSNSDNGRHLGFSMTGVLQNILLTRSELYIRVINLFGACSETQTEVLFNEKRFAVSDLVEEIHMVYGYTGLFIRSYNYRINLISAYWDIFSNSHTVPTQLKFDELNEILIKLKSEDLTDISGAIMLNSFVSNIVRTINNTDLERFLQSESVSILAQLMMRISSIVKEFTTNPKKTSRLITTHRLYSIANAILMCSNFVLESKENYNLLDSSDRNNLKRSISSITIALKNILVSIVSQQVYALNDLTIKLKYIEFRVHRLVDEEKLTETHINDINTLKLVPTPKLHINVISFKKNPFWWSNGYKINTDIKIIYLSEATGKIIDVVKSLSSKTIPYMLQIHNFNALTISGEVKSPNLHANPEVNDKIIAVYKIESEANSLSFINFTYIQNDTGLRVVILKGLRPDFEYMTSPDSKIITTNSSVIKFRMNDLKEGKFFYIGILPSTNIKGNETVGYKFTIFSAACRIWKYNMWTTSIGCVMGSKLSEDVLICDCPLKSEIVGGHVYVPSHQFNPFFDFPLFISERDYPMIVVILIIVFLFYFILLIWTRKMDKKDRQEINVIVLEDNVPHDTIFYLVGVFTGARLGAGTTSNVGLRLLGEDGFSRCHILNCLQFPILKSNSDNWFLLVTPHHLGSLTDILLWTDHSGPKPNWYCSKIQVFDLARYDNDFFFIESWFGITAKEIHLEGFEECATTSETNKISRIISENVLYGFMESHFWASVFFKHPRSPVTRTQRLTIVICGVLVNILVCTLLYYPTSPQSVDFSSFAIFKDTLTIGMIGSLAECLVSFVVMYYFYSSYTITESPVNFRTSRDCPDMYHLKRSISTVISKPKWFTILQSFITQHVRPIKSLPLQSEKHTLVGITIDRKKIKNTLFLCIVIMIACSNLITICGFQYGKKKIVLLYTSILFSIFQTNFIIIPIKIITIAILLGCTKTRYYELMTFSIGLGKVLYTLRKKYTKNYKRFLSKLRNLEMYKPPSGFKIHKLLPEYQRFVLELAIYYTISCISFLCVIIWLIQLFQIRLYFLTNMESLCRIFGTHELCETVYRYDLENVMEFWDSLPIRILPVLFTKTWYNGDNMSLPQEIFHNTGWLRNGDYRLIGVPRLRQIRVKPKMKSVPDVMKNISNECLIALSEDTEDHGNYGMRWSNDSHWDLELFDASPWKYTEPSHELGRYLRGSSGYIYDSGGYIASLHRDLVKTKASLSSLFDTNWIDHRTRAIIVDFTMYNANSNVYTVTNIVTEYLVVGSVKVVFYFKSITLWSFIGPGVLFTLTFIFFIVQLICLMNIGGAKTFLSNLWGLFDCLILIVFVYTTVLYCRWMLRVSEGKDKLSKQGKDVHFSIEDIIAFSDHVKRMVGILFSFMLFRLLRVIRFNEDIRIYAQDLLESRTEVFFGCLITAILMFVQFRLIMFLTTSPSAYNMKDVLIFRSQFKNIVRHKYHETTGKVLAFMLNFTSQLGIFTLMLSQYHHFKKAQKNTRVKNLERKKERAEYYFCQLGKQI